MLLPREQQEPAAARARPFRRLEASGRGGHGSWLCICGWCFHPVGVAVSELAITVPRAPFIRINPSVIRLYLKVAGC